MPSANIPLQLYDLHVRMAVAAEQAGESTELVESLVADASAFLVTGLGGERASRYAPVE